MKRLTTFIVSLALTCIGNAAAQDSPSDKTPDESCDQFKIRIVRPPAGVDFKLRVAAPPEGVDYKLRIINPCKEAALVATIPPDISQRKEGTGLLKLPPFRFEVEPKRDEGTPPRPLRP